MQNAMNRRSFVACAGALAGGAALSQASGALAEETPKPEEGAQAQSEDTSLVDGASHEAATTESADIVVVGAGGSGLAAAYEAAQQGKKVILLEKLGITGGSTQFAEGIAACESSVQKDMGIELTRGDLYNELVSYSHYRANPAVVSAFVNNSAETVEILKNLGVNYLTVTAFDPTSIFYTWHLIDGHVAAACEAVAKAAADAGADIRLETPAVELLCEDGKVSGVIAQNPDGTYVKIEAPVVILGTGGYAMNPAMIDEYSTFSSKDVVAGGSAGNTGDGIKMALSAGAQTDNIGLLMVNGATVEGKTLYSHTNNAATQPYLWVNEHGERFTAETAVMEFPNAGNALGRQPDGVQYTIFDQDTYDHLVNEGNEVGVGAYVLTGTPLDQLPDELAQDVAEGACAWKSDDIRDLADQAGIDPDKFEATVNRYNELCDAGDDEDMFKPADYLRPVKTAPFYAIKSKNTFVITINGIKIDGSMRALDADDEPIGGLYVCGVDASGLYGDTYAAVAAGAACGFAWTSGRIAARDAVSYLG